MYSKIFRWLSLFGLMAVVAFDAAAQAPATTAPAAVAGTQLRGDIRASRVVGQVTWEDKATKVVSPLTENQVIHDGSIVHTGADSSVLLLFSSGASISLAHTSDLDVEQFTQDPFGSYEPAKATEEPSISNTSIKLTRGELVGNVKKLRNAGQPGGSKFTVGTPVGAAGIRGTTFRIVYRPTGNGQAFNFVMTTLEGNVEVTIGTGTVAAPPVAVTDNNEVVINNVTVDTTTGTITVPTATGGTVVVTAPPQAQLADVANIQTTAAQAQQIAQVAINVVFTTPTTPNPNPSGTSGNGGGGGGTTDNSTPQNNSTDNTGNNGNNGNDGNNGNNGNTPSTSPPPLVPPSSLTPGAGGPG